MLPTPKFLVVANSSQATVVGLQHSGETLAQRGQSSTTRCQGARGCRNEARVPSLDAAFDTPDSKSLTGCRRLRGWREAMERHHRAAGRCFCCRNLHNISQFSRVRRPIRESFRSLLHLAPSIEVHVILPLNADAGAGGGGDGEALQGCRAAIGAATADRPDRRPGPLPRLAQGDHLIVFLFFDFHQTHCSSSSLSHVQQPHCSSSSLFFSSLESLPLPAGPVEAIATISGCNPTYTPGRHSEVQRPRPAVGNSSWCLAPLAHLPRLLSPDSSLSPMLTSTPWCRARESS